MNTELFDRYSGSILTTGNSDRNKTTYNVNIRNVFHFWKSIMYAVVKVAIHQIHTLMYFQKGNSFLNETCYKK